MIDMPNPLQQLVARVRESTRLSPLPDAQLQLLSPFATSTSALASIAYHDVFDLAPKIVTRADAIGLPAVAKGRNLLVASLSPAPLVVLDDPATAAPAAAGTPAPQPRAGWLQRAGAGVSPQHRIAWTVDDLIFYGVSLWLVERDAAGAIVEGYRWPIEQWEIDADNRVVVNGAPLDPSAYLLIPGLQEGLLGYATRTLRGGRLVEEAWVRRANDPIPVMELHMTRDNGMSDDDAKQLAETWDAARRKGATAVTPADIELNVHGQVDPAMFTEARNTLRLDVAGFLGLPGSALDGSLSTASLTYSTQEGRANEMAQQSLPLWTTPIEARLSLDDVVPAGQRVRFDLSAQHTLPVNPTGTPTED